MNENTTATEADATSTATPSTDAAPASTEATPAPTPEPTPAPVEAPAKPKRSSKPKAPEVPPVAPEAPEPEGERARISGELEVWDVDRERTRPGHAGLVYVSRSTGPSQRVSQWVTPERLVPVTE